jgi:hypothetical protein
MNDVVELLREAVTVLDEPFHRAAVAEVMERGATEIERLRAFAHDVAGVYSSVEDSRKTQQTVATLRKWAMEALGPNVGNER